MKKIIYSSIFSLFSVFTFGQSVTITPNKTFNISSGGDNYIIESSISTIGIQGFRFNGTPTSKTPVLIGDRIFRIGAGGYINSSSRIYESSMIRFDATENWSSSGNGSKMSFFTTNNGATSFTERLTIDHDGKVGIGLTSPASNLHVHQPNATPTYFQITNSDAGITSTDGLRISYNNNTFLFPYQANIMNQETYGGLGLGTNNLVRLNIDSQGDIRAGSINSYAGSSKMMVEDNSACCSSVRSTLTLLESELTDGPRLKFTNQNSTGSSLFWDIYGNPKSSGDNSNAIMSFYYSTGAATGNNVLQLYGNGNSEHQNFTKLGSDAPSIKMKELSGTTSMSAGGTIAINHGLTLSKILSVSVLVNANSGNDIPPNYNSTTYAGYQYFYFVNPTQVVVENSNGNDVSIRNRPIKILVTYKE